MGGLQRRVLGQGQAPGTSEEPQVGQCFAGWGSGGGLGLQLLFVRPPASLPISSLPLSLFKELPVPHSRAPQSHASGWRALMFGFLHLSESVTMCLSYKILLASPSPVLSSLVLVNLCSYFAGVSGWSRNKHRFSSSGLTGLTGILVGQTQTEHLLCAELC